MENGIARHRIDRQSLCFSDSIDRSLRCRNEGIPSILAAQQGESDSFTFHYELLLTSKWE